MSPRPGRFDIREDDQITALGSPVRHQLVQTIDLLGPCSVRTIANRMGRVPEALYYHMNHLVEVGLVEVTGEQVVNRRPEKFYDVVGRPFRVDPKRTDPAFLAMVGRSAAERLRLTSRALAREIERSDAIRDGAGRSWRLEQQHARLSKKGIVELNRRIDEITQFLREADRVDGETVIVTLATSRIVPTDPDAT